VEIAELRSKVIQGLECCTAQSEDGQPLCCNCPYCGKDGMCLDHLGELMTDALELIKMDAQMEDGIFRAFQDACDRIDDRAKKQLELTLLTDPDYRLEAVMFSGGCSNAGSVISVSEDDMK